MQVYLDRGNKSRGSTLPLTFMLRRVEDGKIEACGFGLKQEALDYVEEHGHELVKEPCRACHSPKQNTTHTCGLRGLQEMMSW